MEDNSLHGIRYSATYLLACAVLELWPDTKLAIGSTLDDGFCYDFEFQNPISESDLVEIETRMTEIKQRDIDYKKDTISLKKAKTLFLNQPYKLEIVEDLSKDGNKKVSILELDKYLDLCEKPNQVNFENVKKFKLLSVSGAYWRGSENNKMLTRIYGTCFPNQKELDEYLITLEEAEKRDHRRLGKSLDLFTFSDLVGSGLPLYTPKGSIVRRSLNDYIESVQVKKGYTQVWTPQLAKAQLFKISGHYDKYKDFMFRVISNFSDEEFYLKPMNCPQHTQIYLSKPRSYRDLPLRYSDFAMLYRDEKPGEIKGLGRVKAFSQDDCHIFCREDQIEKEMDTIISMIKEIMQTFDLKYRYRLSTRDLNEPEKYLGDPKIWDKSEKLALEVLKRNGIEYVEGPGEAAFYGPKMDLLATDSLGREWQLSTIQIDYIFPERFNLEYTDEKGNKARPVMIHRAIIGSPERFIMILLEHYAGAFPVWLSPVQVKIIPISEKSAKYSSIVAEKLIDENVRVEIDDRGERMQSKIRDAEKEKVPYMLIIGPKESESNSVAVRVRGENDLGVMKIKDFLSLIKEDIFQKKQL